MKRRIVRLACISLFMLSVGTASAAFTAVIWPQRAVAACGSCSTRGVFCFGGCTCHNGGAEPYCGLQ